MENNLYYTRIYIISGYKFKITLKNNGSNKY